MGRPALDKPGTKNLYIRGLDDLTLDVLHVYTSFGNRSQADVIAEALRVFTSVRAAENHHWAKWCQDRHYGREERRAAKRQQQVDASNTASITPVPAVVEIGSTDETTA